MRGSRLAAATAAGLYGAIAIVYLVAFLLFVGHRDEASATLAGAGLSGARLADAVSRAMVLGGAHHLVLVGLLALCGLLVFAGRTDGARLLALPVLAIDAPGAVFSRADAVLPRERPYIVAVQAIVVLAQPPAIWLLRSSRRTPPRLRPTTSGGAAR